MSEERVLLSVLLQKSQVQEASEHWLKQFNSNPVIACKNIFELMMHLLGYKCNAILNEKDFIFFETMDPNCFENMLESQELRPLFTEHHFLKNFSGFLSNIFIERVVSDEDFMGKIKNLLQIMFRSKWKSARFSVSVFTYNIIQCIANLKLAMPTPSTSSSSQSVSSLLVRDIVKSVSPFFSLLVMCVLDVSPQERQNSIKLFWELIMEFPTLFMTKSYLRYIFWAMYDESHMIRIFGIKAFGTLVENKDLAVHLDIWPDVLSAFFRRANDINRHVAAEAFNALNSVHKTFPELFNQRCTKYIVTLMFIGKKQINSVAASFLYKMMESLSGSEFFRKLFHFLDAFEDEHHVECDAKFIDVFLPVAEKTLLNWKLWSDLLINDSFNHRHKVRICNLLTLIMEKCTFFKGEMCQLFPKEQIAGLSQAEKSLLTSCEIHVKAITNQFASNIFRFWNINREDEFCLKYLLKIPKYCDIEKMKPEKVCSHLVMLQCISESCIDEIYSVLTNLLRRMKLSDKWTDSVSITEKTIIDSVGRKFSKSCQKIASSPIIHPNSNWSVLLKRAVKLAKHIDLTKTGFNIQAFEALSFGIHNKNDQITKTALHMCYFIVEKQVSNVTSGNHSPNDLQESLQNLEINVKKIMPMLLALLATNNHSVRIQGYTVLCKIYLLFSPLSEFVKKFPQFDSPKPSLIEIEWLNCVFYQFSEKKNEVDDDESYYIIKSALQNFCLLLTAEVIPLLYITSTFPFLSCYSLGKYGNYNSTLQPALEKLFLIKHFLVVFLNALKVYCKVHSVAEAEKVVEGVINVYILKLPPSTKRSNLLVNIIGRGAQYSKAHSYLPMLDVLSHFIRLISPDLASLLIDPCIEALPADNDFVKKFMSNLRKRSGHSIK